MKKYERKYLNKTLKTGFKTEDMGVIKAEGFVIFNDGQGKCSMKLKLPAKYVKERGEINAMRYKDAEECKTVLDAKLQDIILAEKEGPEAAKKAFAEFQKYQEKNI